MTTAREKALELGAKEIAQGINWTWALGFPTPEAGQAFVKWLTENNYDHRGYYQADWTISYLDGVRFR